GDFRQAEEHLSEAVGRCPDNAVAAHGWAHHLYDHDDDAEAAAFLGQWLDGYDRGALYRSHISWHQAIVELSLGRVDRALDLYSTAIDPAVAPPTRTTLADSVGLLWRCILAGVDRTALP